MRLAELTGCVTVLFLMTRWLYDYLTIVFVGPRPRGGTRATEFVDTVAYLPPRSQPWRVEELARYAGTGDDESGPILLAADGIVFNVAKGRKFYGPGGEYQR